jgi:hemoglobin
MPGEGERTDLRSRADIERLVDTFYGHIRADARLGPIFNTVAQVDWATHLPRMYAFWESVLFGVTGFKGHPLAVHRLLAGRTPLSDDEFRRWLQIFGEAVDELFSGPMASEAKARAAQIAAVMQLHIAADQPNNLLGQQPTV